MRGEKKNAFTEKVAGTLNRWERAVSKILEKVQDVATRGTYNKEVMKKWGGVKYKTKNRQTQKLQKCGVCQKI